MGEAQSPENAHTVHKDSWGVRGRVLVEALAEEPPGDPSAAVAGDGDTGSEDGGAPVDQEAANPGHLDTGAESAGDALEEESGAEGAEGASVDLPTQAMRPRLDPPAAGSCRVRAWQEGRELGTAPCEADGSYALALSPQSDGKVALELLVEGHLRGVITVDLGSEETSEAGEGSGEETGESRGPNGDGDTNAPPQEESPQSDPDLVADENTPTSEDGVRWLDAPTVALGPGFVVTGQTVDARGQPIAGVSIEAMPQPGIGEPEPWRTVSDEQGHFSLSTLPYGPVSLQAHAPGYALSVVEAISPEDQVWMVLDALIDLEGSAVADPELLARARVRLEGSSVWPAIERPLGPAEDSKQEAEGPARVLGPGDFVFEALPDGIYGVEVVVPAAEPGGQEYASVPLENVTPDLRVSLAVVPAFRVPVRVEDPDGSPVVGARVTLAYGQLGMLQKIAESGVDGRTAVGPVVPGPYLLRVDADGFLPPEPVEVEVGGEGYEGEELVLVVARPARIEGVVVDEDERPVAGAEVLVDSEVDFAIGEGDARARMFAAALGARGEVGSLGVTQGAVPDIPLFFDEDEGASLSGVVADEDGRFVLDMLLPGTHRIWAVHGDHAASAVQTLEVRSGEVRSKVVLTLREGVALTGVLRTRNGEPIPGGQIDLGDGLVLATDERGVFDAGFRRGKQRLVVRAPGMVPQEVVVDLRKGAEDIEVVLEPAEAHFEGRVVDGNGRPIPDVEVELRPVDGLSPSLVTWTDAKGRYEFEELGPGGVELMFSHPDFVPADARSTPDEGLVEQVLDAGWTIDLLVRSAVAGEALEGVRAQAGHVEGSTDEAGRVELTGLVGEAVEVELSAPGWLAQQVRVRDDGSGRVELTVELFDGGALEGTVDDDIGDPVSGARVQAMTASGELLGEAKSDNRGRWRIDGVPAGDVVVRADPPPAWSAELAPIEEVRSDVIRGEVTSAIRLRFERL